MHEGCLSTRTSICVTPMSPAWRSKWSAATWMRCPLRSRVRQQSWSDDDTLRCLEEVDIHKGDVSVVNWGATPNTSAKTLRNAVRMLANGEIREDELAELRAMSDEVDAAIDALRSTRYIDLGTRSTRDMQDGDDVDVEPNPQNTLAQAVHDLVSNADGVWCSPSNVFEEPDMAPQNNAAKNTPAELRAAECANDNLASIAELRAALEAEAA